MELCPLILLTRLVRMYVILVNLISVSGLVWFYTIVEFLIVAFIVSTTRFWFCYELNIEYFNRQYRGSSRGLVDKGAGLVIKSRVRIPKTSVVV